MDLAMYMDLVSFKRHVVGRFYCSHMASCLTQLHAYASSM